MDINEFCSQFSDDDFAAMELDIASMMLTTSIDEKIDWLQDSVITAMARSEDLDLETARPPMLVTKPETIQVAGMTIQAFLTELNYDKEFINSLVFTIMLTMLTLDGKLVDNLEDDSSDVD